MDQYKDCPIYFQIYKKLSLFLRTIAGKAFDLLLSVVLVVLLLGFLLGYRVLYIASPSMEPTIKTTQFVVAKSVNDDTALGLGDIITYQRPDKAYTITHRIVDVVPEGFVLKGDNNVYADDLIVTRDMVKYQILYY